MRGKLFGTIIVGALGVGITGSAYAGAFVLTDLGVDTEAFAVNSAGQVVGGTFIGGSTGPVYNVPTIWNAGVPTNLTPLSGLTTGYAYSVNNSGQIVGWGSALGTSTLRAITGIIKAPRATSAI
jgi:uncharacterized membrane protein